MPPDVTPPQSNTQPQTLFSGSQPTSQPQTLFSGSQSQSAPSSSSGSQLDPDTVNLAKAIRQTESGGDFTVPGKSGEYGAYQFTEPTWNAWAKQYGITASLQESTPEEQNAVAYNQIKSWKDQGYNVAQIASMWNAGAGEPNAYTGKFSDGSPSSGVNKDGAKYNVQDYAYSVANAYQTLKNGGQVGADPNNPSSVANTQSPSSQPSSLGGDVLGGVKWLGNTLFPIGQDLYNDVTGKNTGASKKTLLQQVADGGLSALSVGTTLASFLGGPEIEGADAALDTGVAGAEAASNGGGLVSLLKNPIAQGVGIGAASGALGAVGQGGGVKQALIGAGAGAATGGVLGGAGQFLSSMFDNLPTSMTQGVLKGITPENAQYFLDNYDLGSPQNLVDQNQASIEDLDSKLKTLVTDPKYDFKQGMGQSAIQNTINQIKDSSVSSPEDVASALKNTLLGKDDTIDRVVAGNGSADDINELRKSINATRYTKTGIPKATTADGQITNIFGNYLRQELRGSVDGSGDLLDSLSQEMKLRKPLGKLLQKGTGLTLRDMLGAVGGLSSFGPVGGAAGFIGSKLSESPTANLGLAGLINNISGSLGSPLARSAGLVGTSLASRYAGQGLAQ